jgi:hypothetical protein
MNPPLHDVARVETVHAASRPTRTDTALSGVEKALVVLEIFVSVCGIGGGVYMAAQPTTAMPLRYLEGTWFHTWRWPGLALVFFVGICPALAAVATLRRVGLARLGHLCVGAGLVAWIVLEAAWVVVSAPLQVVVGLIGVSILVLGLVNLRATPPPAPVRPTSRPPRRARHR